MKILILGDLHIGVRNSNPVLFKMMKDFFSNMLFPYIKENGIRHVLQLGDVHDRRKSIDFVIADWITNHFFKWFEENEVDFISLVGNHDSYYKNTISIDGMSQLSDRLEHVQIVKEPTSFDFYGQKFLMVPWVCDENRESCAKAVAENADAETFLLGHFELAGFEMVRGFRSETDCISREDVRKYRKVFSGHYHLTSEHDNIIYVGTPYELNWNDYGDRKRFFVYDTEDRSIEEVFTGCSIHRKIAVNSKTTKQDFSDCKGKFVKVSIEEDVKPKDIEKILSSISQSGAQSVQCITFNQDKSEEEAIVEDIDNPIKMVSNDISLRWKEEPEKEKKAQLLLQKIWKLAEEMRK